MLCKHYQVNECMSWTVFSIAPAIRATICLICCNLQSLPRMYSVSTGTRLVNYMEIWLVPPLCILEVCNAGINFCQPRQSGILFLTYHLGWYFQSFIFGVLHCDRSYSKGQVHSVKANSTTKNINYNFALREQESDHRHEVDWAGPLWAGHEPGPHPLLASTLTRLWRCSGSPSPATLELSGFPLPLWLLT